MKVPPGPLRSRNFRLLLTCNVISVTGTAVAIVAIPSLSWQLAARQPMWGTSPQRSWFPLSSSPWAGWSLTGCRAIR
jgi:hypothetical protein